MLNKKFETEPRLHAFYRNASILSLTVGLLIYKRTILSKTNQ